MIFPHREGGVGDGLLDVSSFDEREVLLDLLQCPARTNQPEQVLDRKTVPSYAGLTAHLARLDSYAVKHFHGLNVPRAWAPGPRARDVANLACTGTGRQNAGNKAASVGGTTWTEEGMVATFIANAEGRRCANVGRGGR